MCANFTSDQAHGRYFTFRGQWFHVWCEFISENNTGTTDPESPIYRYRDSWMVYTHYLENGEMEDDWNFLDAHGPTGVGQYDATWEQIEAEWFMVGTHVDKLQVNNAANNTNAAFAVQFNNASSTLVFANVVNLPVRGTMTLKLAPREDRTGALRRAGGVLAVYAQVTSGLQGPLLASCGLTGRPRVTCPLRSHIVPGSNSSSDISVDLMFVFEPSSGASEATVQLDSWSVAASI